MKKIKGIVITFSAVMAFGLIAMSCGDDSSSKSDSPAASAVAPGTEVTYDFTSVSFSDFPANSLGDSTNGTTVVSTVAATLYLMSTTVTDTAWTIAGADVYGGTKNFKVRFDTAASKCTALSFNGGEAFTAMTGTLADEPGRSITIPVSGAGTVTVTGKAVTSANGSASTFAFICNQDGAILGTQVLDTTQTSTSTTVNFTATTTSADSEAILGFSRAGATGGGMDVYTLKFTPKK
jgi:hypothetical protein